MYLTPCQIIFVDDLYSFDVSDSDFISSVPLLRNTSQFSQDEDTSVFVLERIPVSLINDMK